MGISLTERAASHIKEFLAAQAQEAVGLRIGIRPSGCSGQAYVVETAERVGERDQVFESNGVRVIVDENSLSYLDGTELDYVREGLNEGFKFNNPNVKDTCGCGESFSV